MNNFTFRNPTKLVFGKGEISKLKDLLPKDQRIMVTFGGGSVKSNGVYDQVSAAMEGLDYIEFWGIEPNPTVETLSKAIAIGLENKVGFLLAVGGGSVLDGTKLIASAIANPQTAPWEIVQTGYCGTAIPYASVMTLPATGSEMNSAAVISRKETHEKLAFYSTFPQFSILDPETTFSLPAKQVANGITDVFVHVMEQYMTSPGQSRLMDRWAEGILLTLVEIAPSIQKDQHDYDVMSEFMLCAALALNNMIAMGVTQDWATHRIGHELTAFHGVDHGASLAIVLPGLLRVLKEQKKGKLLQYGQRIWNITEGTEDERAEAAISKTEEFFRSLGQKTRLSELGIGTDTIETIRRRFNDWGVKHGELANVDGDKTAEILTACL